MEVLELKCLDHGYFHYLDIKKYFIRNIRINATIYRIIILPVAVGLHQSLHRCDELIHCFLLQVFLKIHSQHHHQIQDCILGIVLELHF